MDRGWELIASVMLILLNRGCQYLILEMWYFSGKWTDTQKDKTVLQSLPLVVS